MTDFIFGSERLTRTRLDEMLDKYGWRGAAEMHPNYDDLRPFWNNIDDSAICEYVCEMLDVEYEDAPDYVNTMIYSVEMDFVLRGVHWTTQAGEMFDVPDLE